MKKKKNFLDSEEQFQILQIANSASEMNPSLDVSKCYTCTLLYYLVQLCNFELENVPIEYLETILLLYKNPISSYIHYYNEIFYSNNEYAKAIKKAEIKMLGDDPRCPW